VNPRVSVVVPAFDNAAYIEETIEAILAQSYGDFELLIADHASTDATAEIIGRFAGHPKVRLMTTPAGGGAARNWNRVTDAATGEYVKLVCADDLLYPTMLERQVAALDDAGERAVAVACQRDIVDAAGRPLLRNQGLAGLSGVVDGRRAIRRSALVGTNILGEPHCVLLRRAALLSTGGWGDGRHTFLIDQAAYARVLMTGDLVALPESLGAFRVSDTQWSVRLAKEQHRQAAQFHRQLADEFHLLSPTEVRIADLRAHVRAWQRRTFYLSLRLRKIVRLG
jgi:glycosyltransferase involved in cell wall biosynthesis